MKKIAVIYKSRYGATKQYAEWIAEELGAELLNVSQVDAKTLGAYDTVIYGGALYAGGIIGYKGFDFSQVRELVLFTVGLFDPEHTAFWPLLSKGLPMEYSKEVKTFHLQGSINYEKLSFAHQAMMAGLKDYVLQVPDELQSDDDRLLLKTYGGSLDLTDRLSVQPLIEHVTRGGAAWPTT
ncbi:MAG: flavodoxin domain-containing protein [Turicibacter sp.]|nr:flavodoxin domain-containing protein [Turicibacter sp.]